MNSVSMRSTSTGTVATIRYPPGRSQLAMRHRVSSISGRLICSSGKNAQTASKLAGSA